MSPKKTVLAGLKQESTYDSNSGQSCGGRGEPYLRPVNLYKGDGIAFPNGNASGCGVVSVGYTLSPKRPNLHIKKKPGKTRLQFLISNCTNRPRVNKDSIPIACLC